MTSPFGVATLAADPEPESARSAPPGSASLVTPFSEALASLAEVDLEAEARAALLAEFDDEEFAEALEAVADEVAGRHLAAAGTWSAESAAMDLSGAEAQHWVSALAARADGMLASLESHFGDRPVDTLVAGEIDSVAGYVDESGAPLDAQEQFLSALVKKVKKVAQGVGKVVKKGISAATRLLPLGKLFGVLRRLVRPLLERVLARAIGKLPAGLRPLATRLAARFGPRPPAPSTAGTAGPPPAAAPAAPTAPDQPAAGPVAAGDAAADVVPQDAAASESPWSAEALADEMDSALAEMVLSPSPAEADRLIAELEHETSLGGEAGRVTGPVESLDASRDRLSRALAEADPNQPPTALLEDFIPAVMAAMPLVKLGVKAIGRQRVVGFLANALGTLIQGMVGPQAARLLSRHIADAGLGLLGLEAEYATTATLGPEALVAAAEETVREVLSLPPASLENELLLEAVVQDAFTLAATRHFPAAVLRPDLGDADPAGGIWVMAPRAARPHFRYKAYTVVQPLRLTRPGARSIVLGDGETVEDRLLEAGVRSWPVDATAHFYELLPGAEMGHLAAFEGDGPGDDVAATALEFEELSAARPLPFPHPVARRRGGPPGRRHLPPGTRVVRIVVPGRRLRRRRTLAIRWDLTAAQPQLRVHLHLSERVSHELLGHLGKQDMAAVVGMLRRLVGEPARAALAARLRRALAKRGVTVSEEAARALAGAVAEAVSRTVAKQLPGAAETMATAARDPKPGVTLSFAFAFQDRNAVLLAAVPDPTLTIRPGVNGD